MSLKKSLKRALKGKTKGVGEIKGKKDEAIFRDIAFLWTLLLTWPHTPHTGGSSEDPEMTTDLQARRRKLLIGSKRNLIAQTIWTPPVNPKLKCHALEKRPTWQTFSPPCSRLDFEPGAHTPLLLTAARDRSSLSAPGKNRLADNINRQEARRPRIPNDL